MSLSGHVCRLVVPLPIAAAAKAVSLMQVVLARPPMAALMEERRPDDGKRAQQDAPEASRPRKHELRCRRSWASRRREEEPEEDRR